MFPWLPSTFMERKILKQLQIILGSISCHDSYCKNARHFLSVSSPKCNSKFFGENCTVSPRYDIRYAWVSVYVHRGWCIIQISLSIVAYLFLCCTVTSHQCLRIFWRNRKVNDVSRIETCVIIPHDINVNSAAQLVSLHCRHVSAC